MSKIDQLASVFRDHVGVGWPASSSGAQRIIMLQEQCCDWVEIGCCWDR